MKLLKSIALVSVLVPTLLLAVGDENHIGVGTRQMSQEAAEQIEADKAKQAKEEEKKIFSKSIFDAFPPLYYSNSAHTLIGVIIEHDQYNLKLEDGSEWRVHSGDENKILYWRVNDPLTITQNMRWFTKYNYQIINKSNGSRVEAKLFRGPLENGEFSHFIIAKDFKEIVLNDRTHWEISCLDSAIFSDWALGDYIIIGTNSNTFFDSDKEALLINVNMDNCARAKQL